MLLTPNEIRALYAQSDWLLGTHLWRNPDGLLCPAGTVLEERGYDVQPSDLVSLSPTGHRTFVEKRAHLKALNDVAFFLDFPSRRAYVDVLITNPADIRARLEARRPPIEED